MADPFDTEQPEPIAGATGVDDPFAAEDKANQTEMFNIAAQVLKAAEDQAGKMVGHPGARGTLLPFQIPKGGFTTEPWTLERGMERAAIPGIIYEGYEAFKEIVEEFEQQTNKTKRGTMPQETSPTGISNSMIDKATEVALTIMGGTGFRSMSQEALKQYGTISARRAVAKDMVTQAPSGNFTVFDGHNLYVFESKFEATNFAQDMLKKKEAEPLPFKLPGSATGELAPYITGDKEMGFSVVGPGVTDGSSTWQSVGGFKSKNEAQKYLNKLQISDEPYAKTFLVDPNNVDKYVWDVQKGGKDHMMFASHGQADKFKQGKIETYPVAELNDKGEWIVTAYNDQGGLRTTNMGSDKEGAAKMLHDQKKHSYMGWSADPVKSIAEQAAEFTQQYHDGMITKTELENKKALLVAEHALPEGAKVLDTITTKDGITYYYETKDGQHGIKGPKTDEMMPAGQTYEKSDADWTIKSYMMKAEQGEAPAPVKPKQPNPYNFPEHHMWAQSEEGDRLMKYVAGNKYHSQVTEIFVNGKYKTMAEYLYQNKDDPVIINALKTANDHGITSIQIGNDTTVRFGDIGPKTKGGTLSGKATSVPTVSGGKIDIPTEQQIVFWPESKKIQNISHTEDYTGPIMMYHGTSKDFPKFDLTKVADFGHHFGTPEQAAKRSMSDAAGVAESLGEYQSMRERYADISKFEKDIKDVRIIPVVFNAQKTMTMPDLGAWHPLSVARHIESNEPVLAKGFRDEIDAMMKKGGSYKPMHARIREKLDEMGYDSVRYLNTVEGEGWSYIVWRPDTVKSASNPKEILYVGGHPGLTLGEKALKGQPQQPTDEDITGAVSDVLGPTNQEMKPKPRLKPTYRKDTT